MYNSIPTPEINDKYTITQNDISLSLKIGQSTAMLNENEIQIDENPAVVPFIDNDRTLVPLRFISEALGYDVGYNDEDKGIILTKDDKTVNLKVNSEYYTVNGEEFKLDTEVQIYEDRTFVPVRALSELIGMNVEWDSGVISIHN